MPCEICISDKMGNPPLGGSFLPQATGPNGPLVQTTNGPWQFPNATVCTHPLGIFNADTATPGLYTINYTVGTGSCTATSTITINVIQGVPTAPVVVPQQKCTDDTNTYTLWNLFGLNGSGIPTTGTWMTSAPSPGYMSGSPTDPTDDYITPSLLPLSAPGVPTTYTFVYEYESVVPPGIPLPEPTCDNCSQTFTGTVIILPSPNAGNNANVTLCN